ncbi:MAG: sugar ABC transporter substrate-binding protein [Alkalispirochaetaceae bacterium]
MKRLLVVLVALMLLPAFLMAGGQGEGGQKTVAFLFQDLETEFWVAGHRAIIDTLEEAGVRVIEKNANEDANRQLEQTRDVIAQDVDGIIIIPQDGESAVTIVKTANEAGIPIGVFNRPPSSEEGDAIVAVADNETIAEAAVQHMADQARKLDRKVTPAILVGDLGDPNAVARRKGFYNAIEANEDLWTREPIEIPSKWDANVALANLQSAFQANPEIDFLFTSSDFLLPTIRSVLQPLDKWQKIGNEDHVILGGLDGDVTACQMLKEGYLDSTGVQDVFYEAELILDRMLEAIEKGETNPDEWLDDPGFALTQDNLDEREMDMWGCILLDEQ